MTDKIKLEVTPQMHTSFTGERKYTTAKYYTFYNFIKHKTTLLTNPKFLEALEDAKQKFKNADEKELYTRAFYELQDSGSIEFSIKAVDAVMNQFMRARAATSDVARKAAEEKVLKVVDNGQITFNNWDYFFNTIDKLEVVSEDLEPTYKFTTYRTYVEPNNALKTVKKIVLNTAKGVTSHSCNYLESNKLSALSSVLRGASFEEITNSIHLASCIQSICLKNYTVKSPEEFDKVASQAKCKPLIGNQMVMNMLWLFRNYVILTSDDGTKYTMSCDMASTDMSSIEIYKSMDKWAGKCNDMLVCLLCLFIKNAGHNNIFVDVPGVFSEEFLKKYSDKCWRKSLYSYIRQASNSLLGTNGVYDENVRVINTKTYFERLAMYRDYSQTTALLNCLMFVPKRNVVTSSSEKIKIKNSNPKPMPVEDHGKIPAKTLIMWGVVEGLISACPDNAESCAKTMGVIVLPDKCLVTLSNKGKLSVRVGEKSFMVLSSQNINPHDLSLHLSALASFQDPNTLYITPSIIITMIRSTVYNLIKASVGKEEKKGVTELLKKFKNDEGYFRYNACDSDSSELEQIIYSFHHYSPNFVYANLIKCGNWNLKPETVEDLMNYLIGTSCLLLIEHSTLLASRCGLRKKVAGYEDTVKKIKEAQDKYHTVKTMSEVSGSGGDAVVAAQNELINALYKDKKKETISMLYSLTTYGQTGKFNNLAVGYEPEWVDTFTKLVAVERSTVELAISTNDGFAKHVIESSSSGETKQCIITSTLCTNAMSASPFVVTYDKKFLGGGYPGIKQVTNIGNVTNYNCSPLDMVHISDSNLVKTSKEAGTAMVTDKEHTYSHDDAVNLIYSRGKSILARNLVRWTKSNNITAVVRGLKATPVPDVSEADMVTPSDIYAKFAAPGQDSITVKVGELSFSFSSSYASLYSMYKGEELKSNVIDAIQCGKMDDTIKTKMSGIVANIKKTSKGMSNAIEVLGLGLDPLMDVMKGQSEEFCANWINTVLDFRRLDYGVFYTLIEISKTYLATKSMWLAAACILAYRNADHSELYYKSLADFEFTDCNTVADKESVDNLIKCARLFNNSGIPSKKVSEYFSDDQYHLIAEVVGGTMEKYNTLATMRAFLKSDSYTKAFKVASGEEEDPGDIDEDVKIFVNLLFADFPSVSDEFGQLIITGKEYPGSFISYSYDCFCKVINVFTDPKGERLKGNYIPKVPFKLMSAEEAEQAASKAITKSTEDYVERVKNLCFSAGTDPTAFKSKILKMSLIKEKNSFEVKPSEAASEHDEECEENQEEEDVDPAEEESEEPDPNAPAVSTESKFPPPPPPPPAAGAAATDTNQGDTAGAGTEPEQGKKADAKSEAKMGMISKVMKIYPPLQLSGKNLCDSIQDLIDASPDNDDTKQVMSNYINLAIQVSDFDIHSWGMKAFDNQYVYASGVCDTENFDSVLDLVMTSYGDVGALLNTAEGDGVGKPITAEIIGSIDSLLTPKVVEIGVNNIYNRIVTLLFVCVMHGVPIHKDVLDTFIDKIIPELPVNYDVHWYVAISVAMCSYFSMDLKPVLTFLKDKMHIHSNNLFVAYSTSNGDAVENLFKEPPIQFTSIVARKMSANFSSLSLSKEEEHAIDLLVHKYLGVIVLEGISFEELPRVSKNLEANQGTDKDHK